MLFHRREWFGGDNFLAHAYLGVDFFFLMSGFVIAHAYGERLRSGMKFHDFFSRRVIRLYPLIVAGGLLGAVALTLRMLTRGNPLPEIFPLTLVASIVTAPAVWARDYWPINPPTWSLFFEVLVNIAFGLGAYALGRRALIGVIGSSLAALIAVGLLHNGLSVGNEAVSFWAGVPRVIFPFFVGVGLLHLHRAGVGAGLRIGPIASSLILVASFTLIPKGTAFDGVYDLVCVVLVYPLLVAGAANAVITPAQTKICTFSGDISYPVYILHFPLLWIFSAAGKMLLHRDNVGPLYGAATCLCIVGISFVALKLYDEPVRRWLTARFSPAVGRRATVVESAASGTGG